MGWTRISTTTKAPFLINFCCEAHGFLQTLETQDLIHHCSVVSAVSDASTIVIFKLGP